MAERETETEVAALGKWRDASEGARWIVASAGPSLRRWNPVEVRSHGARVVAVNRAFGWMAPSVDAWAVAEDPVPLWGAMSERVGSILDLTARACPGFEVWCPRDPHEGTWREHFPTVNLRPYDNHAEDYPDLPNGWVDPGWPEHPELQGGTTLHVLAECCALGAKEIHVIGCDMEGTGGWGYEWEQKEATEWAERWKKERAALSQFQDDACNHGVHITLISPSHPRVEGLD